LRRPGPILAALLALSASSGGRLARADDALERRDREAKKACAAGAVDRGIALLAELYAETNDPNYVFNQGRCYQQNQVPEKALGRFREYRRVARNLSADERSDLEGYIRELEAEVARTKAAAPEQTGAPAGTIDAAGAAPAGSERAQTRRVQRGVAYALGGLAVVGVGAGVALGLKVRSLEQKAEKDAASAKYGTTPPGLPGTLRDGGRIETWQWVSYGLAAAAGAGAVTLFVLSADGGGAEGRVAAAPLLLAGGGGGAVEVRF
jgi:hypothetical protein